jgi:DNA primase
LEPHVIDVERVLLSLDLPLYAQRGIEVNGLCPMHKKRTGKEDHNPSWWINSETGAHICFSCGYKGNIYTLVADIKGIDYHEAREYANDKEDMPIDALMRRIKELPEYIQAEAHPIGMSEARLAVYVAPPKIELKKRFLTVAAVETCGVLWDEKNVAWILPIRDPEDFSLWGWQEKGARGRFFRNQPQGVKKSKTVFNVQILKEDAPLIIVESPLDAVRLVGLGYNSISTYGAMPSVDQVKIMRRAPRVIAAFDNDSAGQKASEEMRGHARKYGIELSYFNYAGVDVKDVGDMIEDQIHYGVSKAKDMIYGKEAYL